MTFDWLAVDLLWAGFLLVIGTFTSLFGLMENRKVAYKLGPVLVVLSLILFTIYVGIRL